ncbi:unnamed protein product [Tetraodon nigroviridis]|uniref:(spotted green pufferfish) hypothetical protein n=1 Tax=Tetraodon nigroviridis TaxID=99883 RepID=Q4TIM3_TETNG|nr:unnamed protein product [Tetraodon nigroviridis]
MRGPRLRKEKGRLPDPQEQGCHCQMERNTEFHQAALFIYLREEHQPARISAAEPTAQWAQLKMNRLKLKQNTAIGDSLRLYCLETYSC